MLVEGTGGVGFVHFGVDDTKLEAASIPNN